MLKSAGPWRRLRGLLCRRASLQAVEFEHLLQALHRVGYGSVVSTQIIELSVHTLSTMFTEQSWSRPPFFDKWHNVVLHIMELWEDWLGWCLLSVCLQELLDVFICKQNN